MQGVSKRPRNGFTLVEVIVAMTLLTMVVGGGVAALIQGNRMIEDARDMTRITQILQSEIEELRTMNWSDLNDIKGYTPLPLQGKFAAAFKDRYTVYRLVYDDYYNTEQKRVYVVANWKDSRGNSQYDYIYTRFTKGGLNDYFYRSFAGQQ